MDVPFISSGAMSRAHYALVRKVETAPSAHIAETVVRAEATAIQNRLRYSALSLKQVKESLVLLLYCSHALHPDVTLDVSFGLPHAISMAEASKTVQDKRLGYFFCGEVMPRNHELQLMLVNTLRKDLESNTVARCCLALDVLIASPPEDVYPAVQNRLYELISHHSPHIRRRTLLAFRTLSEQNKDILRTIRDRIRRCLEDGDTTVVHTTLTLIATLTNAGLISGEKLRPVLTNLLRRVWSTRTDRHAWSLLVKTIQAIQIAGPSGEDFEVFMAIVRSRERNLNVLKYQCFMVAALHPTSVDATVASTFLKGLRHLLVSEDANDIYTFVTCLHCLDPKLWAGTVDIPPVLEGWEVERIVNYLNSNDGVIRRKTLHVLLRVDRSLVEAFYQKLIASLKTQPDGLKRALEVSEILSGEDGESYARHILHLLQLAGDEVSGRYVIQEVVEGALHHVHNASSEFRAGCLGVFFAIVGEKQQLGPTLMAILAALICEFLDSSPVSPMDLLHGLARALPTFSAALQEICLLTMLRVAAKCDSVPEDVLAIVRKVQEAAGRQIKRRCEQFHNLSQEKSTLNDILARTKSPTLPALALALETPQFPGTSRSVRSSPNVESVNLQDSPRLSYVPMTPGKLRYAAYEPPKPTPRLRRASTSSSRSTDTQSHDPDELLSRTVTAGDLALAVGRKDLRELGTSPVLSTHASPPPLRLTTPDDLSSQMDLLNLDSPFLSEPPAPTTSSSTELNFENVWDALTDSNTRGWCEATIDVVVRKLQSMQHIMRVIASDQPPFHGDLKIILSPSLSYSEHQGVAVLRLKESDDESCLWQLRCEDDGLRLFIKELLTDIGN